MKFYNSLIAGVFILLLFSCSRHAVVKSNKTQNNIKIVELAKVVDGEIITNDNFGSFLTNLEKQLLISKTISSKIRNYDIQLNEDNILLVTYTAGLVSKTRLKLTKDIVSMPIVLTTCTGSTIKNGGYPGDCACSSATESSLKTCIRGLNF